MSKENQNSNLAVGLIVVIGTIIIFYVGWTFIELKTEQRVSEYYSRQDQANDGAEEVVLACSPLSGIELIECLSEKFKEGQQWDQERRDLHAQEAMALWAFWMFIAAVIGSGAAIYGLLLLRNTWLETKRTADVAREIGQAQTRAYLSISSVDYDVLRGGDISFTLKCRNMGQSPAKNVEAVFQIKIEPYEGTKSEFDGELSLPDISERDTAEADVVYFNTGTFPDCRNKGAWLHLHMAIFATDVFNEEIWVLHRSTRLAISDKSVEIQDVSELMSEAARARVVDRLRLRWRKRKSTQRA